MLRAVDATANRRVPALAAALRGRYCEQQRRRRGRLEKNVELGDAEADTDRRVALARRRVEGLLQRLSLLELARERATFGVHPSGVIGGHRLENRCCRRGCWRRDRRRLASACLLLRLLL